MGFRRLEPYEGLVRVLHRLGQDDQAFYWSEYTRARVLVEAIARTPFGASLGLSGDLRQHEDGLANRIAALSRQVEERPDDRQVSFQLQLAQAEQAQLVERLRREYPEYASMRYPEPLRPDQLNLAPAEALLAYKVTQSETLLFLVREGKVERVFEIPLGSAELSSMVVTYRASFGGVRQKADLGAMDVGLGEHLYQLLLAPALAELRQGERAVVVPDGVIGLLPLEALVLQREGEVSWREGARGLYPEGVRYVGDDWVFSYWQSGTAMATARQLRKGPAGERVLVVADPVFTSDDPRAQGMMAEDSDSEAALPLRGEVRDALRTAYGDQVFARLENSARLLEALRPLYRERLHALLGLQAQEAAVKREPLEDYGAIIFATHGVLDKDFAWLRQPALLLSLVPTEAGEDGFLTMTEVMEFKLRADVVALMACDTGAGKTVGGEGVMAMGRAFQYAGARSVLASLWKAEDASTNLLTVTFLEEMMRGQDKAAALQTARQRVREAGYQHPFYWAGFILVGERSMAAQS
jgi:hypothetical protein